MNNDFQNEEGLIQEEFLHGDADVNEDMLWENNKKANILCLIALGCDVLPLLVFVAVRILALFTPELDKVPDIVSGAASTLGTVLMIAGIVLVIVVRVKYPDNLFGKVLMWVYIALTIAAIVAFIIGMIVCAIATVTCIYSCVDCYETFRTP